MPTLTLKRSRSGRSGSMKSARRCLWDGIVATRKVLTNAHDDETVLAATRTLTRSVSAYRRLLAEEKTALERTV